MSKLTHQDILKLARLARLRLSDEEVEQYSDELGKILEYVEQLSAVDTDGLRPTNQVTGLENVYRKDEVFEYQANPDKLLSKTPNQEGSYIKVKRMI